MVRRRNLQQGSSYQEWLQTYSALIADCRNAIGRPSIIVSVDHEGGAVHRFPAPITRFPFAATYGSAPDAVFEVATAMGEELAALGVNVSFSPVADIHSNPKNPVINERAFGTTATQVEAAAVACARGLRQSGVMPCAKHFPGHGDTSEDSHYAVPAVAHARDVLQQRELLPFKALIADGIEMIMTAHLMVPALDPDNQATISKIILTDILRGELGFKGITIADALGMHGIHSVVTGGTFPVRAHRAGLDLFLVAGDTVSIADAVRMRDEYAAAISQGDVDQVSARSTSERLTQFLDTLPQHAVRELAPEILARHAALARNLASNAPWSRFTFQPVGFE
jgi:beta-N-acetylhexosaminidase